MTFPILLKRDEGVASDESLYYLVAANGLFQVRRTETYVAVTEAQGDVPGLLPEYARLRLDVPRLPVDLLRPVLAFFRAVYEEHGGEAIVILFYSPQAREFRVVAPDQRIPGYERGGRWHSVLQLDYGDAERPDGYLRFGSIHSHADTAAYASAADCADERHMDGLHVVYGNVDRADPTRSAAFVVNGTRFPLLPDEVLEPCPVPAGPAREEWMARVERVVRTSAYGAYGSWGESA